MCEDGIKWIYETFNDCIVTTTDKWSFAIGLCSSCFWTIANFPQVYTIYKTKSVEGISPFLFSCLFLGDTLSLFGCILNNGLVTQILTYMFYIGLDSVLLFQYIYYRFIRKCCAKRSEDEYSGLKKAHDMPLTNDSAGTLLLGSAVTAAVIASSVDYSLPYTGKALIGSIFGWCSATICMTSRIPQVILNFKRRFVSNLSPYFFACTILGNVTYFLALIIRNQSPQFMWKQAPWLVECLGPLTCDIITAFQMCIFGFSTKDYDENVERLVREKSIDDVDTRIDDNI